MPPHNRSKVPIGTVLEGKFRITREIGRGGMAAVYEAENIDIGKRVAVKILAAELITSRVVRERFIREARASASIRSPFICDVYDVGMFEDRPFLVMELLEGESLYDMMTRVRRIDLRTTVDICVQTARGLAKAHEANVIHRDLKPENIFLTHNEDGELVAKLLDFGLAKFYEPTSADEAQPRLTREGALFGTPAYMSPEQAKGQGEVDHRCDLWALGCIAYECLTGQTVWNVDQGVAMILAQIAGAPIPNPRKLRPDLHVAFEHWFHKALQRDPDKRFQTAKEFGDSLNEVLEVVEGRRVSPQMSAEEISVDALLSEPQISSPGFSSPLNPLEQPPISSQRQDVTPAPSQGPPTLPPGMKSAGPGRAIAVLFMVAAVAVGGYAVWLYALHPPGADTADASDGGALGDAGDAAVEEVYRPLETEPFALQIGSAQEWLQKGKRSNALKMFKEAYNNGGSGVARTMLSHASAAFEDDEPSCPVTGLGRPRPFDVAVTASRPSLVVTSKGVVVAWADNHQDESKRQGFATVLDEALRRVTPARAITPEAQSVRHPQLLPAGDKLAFVYWDSGGHEPGVYVRMLFADGRIAGAARRISAVKRHQFYPALARAEDGSFWAVWEEAVDKGEDIMARHLNAELEPMAEAVRLTAFPPTADDKAAASKPDLAIAHEHLNVVFAVEHTSKTRQILQLRVSLSDPKLATGVKPVEAAPKPKKKEEKSEGEDEDDQVPEYDPASVVGTLRPVSSTHGKNAQPRVSCTGDGCYVAWDDELAGALIAFVDKEKGETIWHREFAKKGARPALATTASGTLIAWFEESRLKVAPVSRDGVGKPSLMARVSGYQPYPSIAAGAEPGEWFVAWRDYEAGHLEAFVVRASCE